VPSDFIFSAMAKTSEWTNF